MRLRPTARDACSRSVRESGVYLSTDDGESWKPVLENVDAWTVAASPNGTLYAGIKKGLYQSTTGGEEWEEVTGLRELSTFESWCFPLAPHIANIGSLAFSHKNPDAIYAGVEVGGVVGSADKGKTWKDLREGIHLDIHTLLSAPGNDDVLHAATGRGMFRSMDAGESWEAVNEGLESIYMIPAMIHPKDPQILFTAASQGRPRYWRRPGGRRRHHLPQHQRRRQLGARHERPRPQDPRTGHGLRHRPSE